jgi:hypothetical protein
VAALIGEGRSLDAVLAANVAADYEDRWGYRPGFFFTTERLITLIHDELKNSP